MSNFNAISASAHVLTTSLGSLGAAIRIGWGWMILLTAAQTLDYEQFLHGALPVLALWFISPVSWLEAPLQAYGLYALGLLAFASYSVNWHCHQLRGEETSWRHVLRLDRPVWLVFLNLLPLLAASIAADMAIDQLTGQLVAQGVLHWGVALLLKLALMAIPLVLLHRVATVLPAAALGREDYGYADAWRDSRGQPAALALFVLVVLASVFLAPA